MVQTAQASSQLFNESSMRLERRLLEFEQQWQQGERPAIESQLNDEPEERLPLLTELVLIDLEYRFKAGDDPSIQSYLARFPELCQTPQEVERMVAAERHWRHRLSLKLVLVPLDSKQDAGLIEPSTSPAECGETVACVQCGKETWVFVRAPGQQVACRACRQTIDWNEAAARDSLPRDMRRLGKYELQHQVGEGTFGIVYRALDLGLNRIVAVKVARSGQAPERFLREAEKAARLQHPLIVTVHDSGCADSIPYIVCEFVEGKDLEQVQQTQPLDFKEAAELVSLVADAIDYAHNHGVIHRDLKPSNIMLETLPPAASSDSKLAGSGAGSSGIRRQRTLKYRPRVMDFGLARQNDSDATMSLFGPGCILGTAAYMSPEQARGESDNADRRSDVYSLGVILYRLLTGEVPFRGTMPMVIHQVIHEEPPPPRRMNERIPRDLETIAQKCLAKEPLRRYQTAEQLAADLRRFLWDLPIQARPISSAERCWRWCRRNKPLAAAGVLAVALTVAVVALSLGFGIYQAREKSLLKQAQRDSNRGLAEQMIDRAETLFQQSQPSRGMLFLAQAVNVAQTDAPDLARVARANLASRQDTLHSLQTILEASQGITAVCASEDGRFVAAALTDGTVRQWELASGGSVRPPIKHPGELFQILYARKSDWLITAGDDTILVWNAETGQLQTSMRHFALRAIAFDAKSERILSAGQRALLWDANTGEQLASISDEEELTAACFDPQTDQVWTASAGGLVQHWALIDEAGELEGEPQQFCEHPHAISALGIEADGKFLWTGSFDGAAWRWNITTGERVAEFSASRGVVTGFGPGARTMVTRGSDGLTRLWDLSAKQVVGQPLQHPQTIAAAAFGAGSDGSTLLTGGSEGTLRVWKTPVAAPAAHLLQHSAPVMAADYSVDGKLVVTAGLDGFVRRFDVDSGQPVDPAMNMESPVLLMRLHPAGRILLTLNQAKQLQAFEIATGQPAGPVIECPDGVVEAIFGSQEDRAFTIDTDRQSQAWDLRTGKPYGPAREHPVAILSIAITPDGGELVSGCVDGTCHRWDVQAGQGILPMLSTRGPLRTLLHSHNGQLLVGSDSGRLLTIWDRRQSVPQARTFVEAGEVHVLRFSPDDLLLAAAGDSQQVRFWDPLRGVLVGQPLDHGATIRAIAFDPTGHTIATAGDDGQIRCWDVATRKPLGPARALPGAVEFVSFSPNGGTLLAISGNGVWLWRLPRPVDLSAEQTMRFVRDLTGQQIDALGIVQALEASQWRK